MPASPATCRYLPFCLLLYLTASPVIVLSQSLMPILSKPSPETNIESTQSLEWLQNTTRINSLELQLATIQGDSARVQKLRRRITALTPTKAELDSATQALTVATCWSCSASEGLNLSQGFMLSKESRTYKFLFSDKLPKQPNGQPERKMWMRKGAEMLVAAQRIRDEALAKYEAASTALNAIPISPSREAAEQYRREVEKLRNQYDQDKEAANVLEDLAHYYTYFALNLNRVNFFPVRHRQHAPLYFNSASTNQMAKFLGRSTSAINPSNGKFSQYNEVFADFIGWTRAAVGVTVVSSKNEPEATSEENRQDEAVQRLATGGGNLLFVTALPVFSFHTRDNHFAIKGHLQPKFATDLPQQGQPADNFAYHSEAAVEFFGYYTGYNSVISPYMCVRAGRNWGNSNFYDNMGRNSHAGFTLFQVDAGLSLGDVVQVGIKYNSGQTFIEEAFPLSIALSLIPKAIIK